MAIICAICQRKQSGIFEDFPLATNATHNRICVKCKNNLDTLLNSDVPIDTRINVKKYFMGFTDISPETRHILNGYFETACIHAQPETETKNATSQPKENILMTTGYNFEGYKIVDYTSVVTSEIVIGTGVFSEMSAKSSDFFGVKNDEFSQKLKLARESVTSDLIFQASELGVNAIIGLNYHYTVFKNNMICVIANGTAVKIEPTITTDRSELLV